MTLKNNVAVTADQNKTNVVLSKMSKEATYQENEEIIIIIRNGAAVKFKQSLYYPSLECVNGDGI
ncbi:MAG: hypothetical protein K0R78_447 [Pelosinus sp.]|jgi:hypothetical protein|nr:hypothetical protein [Pelosinus sp.]